MTNLMANVAVEKTMSVEEKLSNLYQLQQLLTKLDQISLLRGELPLEVRDLDDEIAGLETRQRNFEADIDSVKQDINEQSQKITFCQDTIQDLKGKLENVRNNREYDMLSKEIEYQGLEVEFSEKKIREFREELQGRKADLEGLKRYIEERKHDLVIKQKELEQITEETKEEEVVIRQQAHSLEEGIEPRLLAAFKRIRKGTRNGLGVVAVKNAACGGCFNRLTPQRQLDIRMRKKVIVCEYCGRILVDPEMVDPEY